MLCFAKSFTGGLFGGEGGGTGFYGKVIGGNSIMSFAVAITYGASSGEIFGDVSLEVIDFALDIGTASSF